MMTSELTKGKIRKLNALRKVLGNKFANAWRGRKPKSV